MNPLYAAILLLGADALICAIALATPAPTTPPRTPGLSAAEGFGLLLSIAILAGGVLWREIQKRRRPRQR